MNVQEVFYSVAVKAIEEEIIRVAVSEKRIPFNIYNYDKKAKFAIEHLLRVRKTVLDELFVMTPEYKQLLAEFNEALIGKLLEMRQRVLQLRESCPSDGMDYKGSVFLNVKYPEFHPVQTMRAKAIWAMLTDTDDSCMDREMTGDMHLCYAFHNLYDHCLFSIFDLLWVRDFFITVSSESYDCLGIADEDEIDWHKAQFDD